MSITQSESISSPFRTKADRSTEQEALVDFVETLNELPTIEIASTDEKGRWNQAKHYRQLSDSILSKILESPRNLCFLNGIKSDRIEPDSGKWGSVRASNKEVAVKNIFSIDLDFKDCEGLADVKGGSRRYAARQTWSEIKPWLVNIDLLPWLVVFSGGGLHCHFKFEEPIEIREPREWTQHYEAVAQALQDGPFSANGRTPGLWPLDPVCKNPSRIMRFPCTVNTKPGIEPIRGEVLEHNPNAFFDDYWAEHAPTAEGESWGAYSPSDDESAKDETVEALRTALGPEKIFKHLGVPIHNARVEADGQWWCSSPWRNSSKPIEQSTPSFCWNPSEKVWKCFSSDKGGDAFALIGELRGLEYKDSKDFIKILDIAREITGLKKPANTRPRRTENVHIELIRKLFPRHGKCILDDQIYLWLEQHNRWEPLKDQFGYIKGRARAINSRRDKALYIYDAFEPYSEVWRIDELKSELLINTPKWDERDRIGEIVNHITAKHLTPEQLREIIVEWLAKSYLRIFNPEENQRLLLFTGRQGLGKDGLIFALTGGYQHYAQPLNIINDETKMDRALSQLLVGRVAEFDKMKFVDVSMLKDIVTKPWLFFDQKYLKMHQRRQNRVSLIASANTANVLRDWTGNRRFDIVEIADMALERDAVGIPKRQCHYPGDPFDPERQKNQHQILAQGIHYAKSGSYEASDETRKRMHEIVAGLTPEDPAAEVAEYWQQFAEDHVQKELRDAEKESWIRTNCWIPNKEAAPIFERLSRVTGHKVRLLQQLLTRHGLSKTGVYIDGRKQRGYRIDFEEVSSDDDFM